MTVAGSVILADENGHLLKVVTTPTYGVNIIYTQQERVIL